MSTTPALIPEHLLVAIATGENEPCRMAREMIGAGELALLMAQTAVAGTSIRLSPTKVSKVLDMTVAGARKKIENCAVRPESRKSIPEQSSYLRSESLT
jgi:hypothetical protein